MQTIQPSTANNPDGNEVPLQPADAAAPRDVNPRGLSDAEVQDRRDRGLANTVSVTNTRTYLEIVRRNAFTLINIVLYATCALLIAMGLYGDALVTVGLVLFN